MFNKIYKSKSPFYLFNLIPRKTSAYATKDIDVILLIKIKHNFFKNTFAPSGIIEWNKLARSYHLECWKLFIFKSNILNFIRRTQRRLFNCYNHKSITLMTQLCQELSHLRDHKFNYNFQNCMLWYRYRVNFWLFSLLSFIWWQKNYSTKHPEQNWLQIN